MASIYKHGQQRKMGNDGSWRKVIFAIALALIASACSGNSNGDDTATPGSGDPATEDTAGDPTSGETASGEPVRIGELASLSGDYQVIGQFHHKGYEFAIEQVNNNGGIDGRPVELITGDIETSVDVAISQFRRLVEAEEVFALVGPALTPAQGAIAPLLADAELTTVTVGGGYAMQEGDDWWFNTVYTTDAVVGSIALYLEEHGLSRVAMLHPDNELGRIAAESLSARADDHGLEIVHEDFFGADATDLTAQATAIRNEDPDVVFSMCAGGACGVVANAVAEVGVEAPLAVSHANGAFSVIPLFERLNDGQVIIPTSPIMAIGTLPDDYPGVETLQEIAEQYEASVGEPMDYLSAVAYDAVMQTVDCAREVGVDRELVRDCLESLDGWSGASGVFHRNPDHHAGPRADEITLLTLSGGEFQLLE